MVEVVGSGTRNWYSAPAESEERSSCLLLLSNYFSGPANRIVYEGIRLSKISYRAAPFSATVATIRFLAAVTFLAVPTLLWAFLNAFVQSEAALLQEGKDFSQTMGRNRGPNGSSKGQVPQNLRILSLNVCTFPGGWNTFLGGIETSGYQRLDRFISLFKEQNADIICLQEVFEPALAIHLRDRLREEGWDFVCYNAGLGGFLPISSGLFVASRLPLTQARYIPFDSWGLLPRGALQLDVGGFDLFAAHLTPSGSDLSPSEPEISKRQNEIATIEAHVREKPTVLVGDLNAEKEEIALIGDLVDASPEEPTCTEQFTLDMVSQLNGLGPAREVAPTALDRVFAKGVAVEVTLIPSFANPREKNPLSDHHALTVVLTTPKTSST